VVDIPEEPRILFHWNVLPLWTGLVALVAADFFLPWVAADGETIVDGGNAVDGLLTVLFTVLALLLAVSRAARDGESLLLKLLPGLLGLATAASTIEGFRFADALLGIYTKEHGAGHFEIGMGVEIVGGCLALIGGLASSAVFLRSYVAARQAAPRMDLRPRREQILDAWSDTGSSLRLAASMLVLLAVGAVGCVLGGLAAFAVSEAGGHGPSYAERLAGLGIFGVLLGPAATVSLWRRFTRRR
jgi:hypothetical protein